MKLNIGGKSYELNAARAIELGVLREDKQFDIKLDENEVATLYFLLDHVGGQPSGARGYSDSVRAKLSEIKRNSGFKCQKKLSLDGSMEFKNSIYLA